jgi:hypothetical protein
VTDYAKVQIGTFFKHKPTSDVIRIVAISDAYELRKNKYIRSQRELDMEDMRVEYVRIGFTQTILNEPGPQLLLAVAQLDSGLTVSVPANLQAPPNLVALGTRHHLAKMPVLSVEPQVFHKPSPEPQQLNLPVLSSRVDVR